MELPKLKTLNLDDNRLDKISKFVYQLTVLETLSLVIFVPVASLDSIAFRGTFCHSQTHTS